MAAIICLIFPPHNRYRQKKEDKIWVFFFLRIEDILRIFFPYRFFDRHGLWGITGGIDWTLELQGVDINTCTGVDNQAWQFLCTAAGVSPDFADPVFYPSCCFPFFMDLKLLVGWGEPS